jgi:hypothetical protein
MGEPAGVMVLIGTVLSVSGSLPLMADFLIE